MTQIKKPPMVFLCDFDGTIVLEDIGKILVERLDPVWWSKVKELYPLLTSGQIGSKSWYYWKYLKASFNMEQLKVLVDQVPIDPGFLNFYQNVKARGDQIVIVSDGFDAYIRLVMERLNITDVPVYCNQLIIDSPIKLDFPHFNSKCGFCGACKAGMVASFLRKEFYTIYIADGIIDRFPARLADHIFAKSKLAQLCEEQKIPFTRFDTFHDIISQYPQNPTLGSMNNFKRLSEQCQTLKDDFNLSFINHNQAGRVLKEV